MMGSHWNYRVVQTKREKPKSLCGGEDDMYDDFAIHEVYYKDNGAIYAYSADAMHPSGETMEELESDIAAMQEAFHAPVLKEWELDELIKRNGEEGE